MEMKKNKRSILLLLLLVLLGYINQFHIGIVQISSQRKHNNNTFDTTEKYNNQKLSSTTSIPISSPYSSHDFPLNFTGTGVNLTSREYANRAGQGTVIQTGNTITCNPSQPWNNYWVECTISNVFRYSTTCVMEHHFDSSVESWSSQTGFVEGNGFSVVDCYLDTISGNPPNCLTIHLSTRTGFATTTTTEWGSWLKHSSNLDNNPIASATLRFWWAYAFDASIPLPIKNPDFYAKVNGAIVYDAENPDFTSLVTTPIDPVSEIVECDITNLVSPNDCVDIEFLAQAQTYASNVDSNMWAAVDNVVIDVTYKVSKSPNVIHLSNNQFSTNGELSFETNGQTSWTFGAIHPITYYFDADWIVKAQRTMKTSTEFVCLPDALFTNWTVAVTPSQVGGGYVYDYYTLLGVDGWSYNHSDPSTDSFILNQQVAGMGSGNHHFTEPNTAISSIIIKQQDSGEILRAPCSVFMRGEQYAVTPTGVIGSYALTIYDDIACYGWGSGWIASDETWTQNNASQFLAIGAGDALGTYLVAVEYRNATTPLHVGFKTTTFSVETYTVAGLSAEENTDGTVTVSGSLGDSASGEPAFYIAATSQTTTPSTQLDYFLTTNLVLEHWRQSDYLVTAAGEEVDFWFNITNTNSTTTLNNMEIKIQIVSLAGENYTLFERSQIESLASQQTHIFNWENNLLSPAGVNTMLRRGIYRIQVRVDGTESGSIYLDKLLPGAYLVVTEDPLLDGYVTALHQAQLQFSQFNTTFNREEVALPDTHFIAAVIDNNHITTETQAETSIHLRLQTSLSDPTAHLQYTDNMTISTTLTGEAGGPPARATGDSTFTVCFYADFGEGYELLDKDIIHLGETASITPDLTCPAASYPLKVNATCDPDYWVSEEEGTLTLSKEVTELSILSVRNFTYSDQGILTAQLLTDDSEPVVGYQIFLELLDVTWVTIGSGATNETGHVSILWTPELPAGYYQIQARAPLPESRFYEAAPTAHGLLVVDRELLILNLDTSTARQGYVTAWVTDDNADPIPGVTLLFFIDGTFHDLTITDAVGAARLTTSLQPGQIIRVTIEEDNFYQSISTQTVVDFSPTPPVPTIYLLGLIALIGVLCGTIVLRKYRSNRRNQQRSQHRYTPVEYRRSSSGRALNPRGVGESVPVVRTEAAEILQGTYTHSTPHREKCRDDDPTDDGCDSK